MTVPTTSVHTPRPWARRLLLPALALSLASLAGLAWTEREGLRVSWWVHRLASDPARTLDAISALEQADQERVVRALRPHLTDGDPRVRYAVAFAANRLLPAHLLTREVLGDAGYQETLLVLQALLRALDDVPGPVLLPCLGREVDLEATLSWIPGSDALRARSVIIGEDRTIPARLVLDGGEAALDRLALALRESPDPWVRFAAAEALGHTIAELPASPRAALRDVSADPDAPPTVRRAALRSLLGYRRPGPAPTPSADLLALCKALLLQHPELTAPAARALATAGSADRGLADRLALPPVDLEPTSLEDHLLGLARLPTSARTTEALGYLLDAGEPEPVVVAKLASALDHADALPEADADASPSRLWATHLLYLCHDPDRALRWLDGTSADGWRLVVTQSFREEPDLRRFLASSPGRANVVKAAAARLERAATHPSKHHLLGHALTLLLTCGGPEATAALERFAASRPDGPDALEFERGLADRMAHVLRGRLPAGLAELRARARSWLRAHLKDGQAGAERVHEPSHPCGQQGQGIPYLAHRTPLACLALLGEDDAPALLAPTVRWLSDPAQDALGLRRPEASNPAAEGFVASAAAVGDVPRFLEEALVLMALHGAVEDGIEAEAARAALKRRVATLLDARLGQSERNTTLLALAVASEVDPAVLPLALRWRAREPTAPGRSPWEFTARRWLGPPPPSALEAVLPPTPALSRCDVWLTPLGLCGPEGAPPSPVPLWARRQLLHQIMESLWLDREQAQRSPRAGVCEGAIVRLGQEDPVVLTAWVALACDALERALAESRED